MDCCEHDYVQEDDFPFSEDQLKVIRGELEELVKE